MSHNLVAVDKDALQMVRNIMQRSGKQEAMDALDKTLVDISKIQIPVPERGCTTCYTHVDELPHHSV